MTEWASIAELRKNIRAGKVTATELVKKSLTTIKEQEEYAAILTINENALDEAAALDKRIKRGEFDGLLPGIPYIAKDNFLTKDVESTAASAILKGFNPPINATAIQKLEDAGAIMVAKANLDAFGHGASTQNSDFAITKNPHDLERVPGGSSGGSAAAVVLGMAPFALGTDTGGSIRHPASLTGSVGYKPTYGLVSRYGVVAMASSTDTIGPITNTVEDAAEVLDVIAGRDLLDSTTIERQEKSYVQEKSSAKGKTFGLIKQHMGDGVDEDVKQAIRATAEKLRQAGSEVKEVDIPSLDLALAVYYIVMPAEVSSNLSRYDGIRYAYRHEGAEDLEQSYDMTRGSGFNDEVKRRVMIGTYVLSSGYYDAYYKKAQTVRTLLIQEFNKAFEGVDFLLGPVSPTTAFKIGENVDDPLNMYLNDIMTVATSLVGVPGISIPVGKQGKLPIGAQLMAPQSSDAELLAAASVVEELMEYAA